MGRRGVPFVVSAPSGTGKTTVCRALVDADPGIEHSVSHTTRAMRAGEKDGVHYHFVTSAEFRRMVEEGVFLEWAVYSDNLYGTSQAALDARLDQGADVLLEIEVQGARQVRERRRDARFVFLLPPSMEVLEQRLRGRGTDDEDVIQKRLTLARRELSEVSRFDYAVVNDVLEETVAAMGAILAAERVGGRALEHAAAAVVTRVRGRFPDLL